MPVISVEHLSKTYRLGQIGIPSPANAYAVPQGCYARRTAGTFTPSVRGETANDLKLWWAKARGKPNRTNTKIGRNP